MSEGRQTARIRRAKEESGLLHFIERMGSVVLNSEQNSTHSVDCEQH